MLYNDLIFDALSDAARKALQMIPEGYQFKNPLIRESIEKGLAQGRVEGRVEGLREMLTRQLAKRFGTLPPWAEERVSHSSGEQLETYLDGVLTAASLEAALQLNG